MPEIIRTMHSVPGIRPQFMERAAEIPADIICFDLEDSVAWDDKPKARTMVAEALPAFPARGRMIFVRINGLETGLAEQDLDAIAGPWLHGVNIPKVYGPEDVLQYDNYLTYLERTRDIPEGQIKIIPWIEQTEALVHVFDILTCSPRLIAAAMGGEDYATDLGVQRTRESTELFVPRTIVANAAAAAGLVAIDSPETDIRDSARFEQNLHTAKALGYRGKFCIHPTQVEIANRVFAPTPEELAWATTVTQAYDEGVKQGLGAVALDGKMIDKPIADRAFNLLAWQRQIEERTASLGG